MILLWTPSMSFIDFVNCSVSKHAVGLPIVIFFFFDARNKWLILQFSETISRFRSRRVLRTWRRMRRMIIIVLVFQCCWESFRMWKCDFFRCETIGKVPMVADPVAILVGLILHKIYWSLMSNKWKGDYRRRLNVRQDFFSYIVWAFFDFIDYLT